MNAEPDIPAFGPDRCAAYLEGTRDAPPREQLLRALRLDETVPRGRALDVGCGPGKEVVELLRAGFEVRALDPYSVMIELTRRRVLAECPQYENRLTLACVRLEDHLPMVPPNAFRLVHAGFVLPFVASSDFPRVFATLLASIAPGGVFVGQLFGPDDEFIRTSPAGTMTCQTAAEASELLAGLEIISHEEVNRTGFIGKGRPKWWHVHHIVARMPPDRNG